MSPASKWLAALVIGLLLMVTVAAVYLTGGTRYAALHAVYVPVILAGGLYGVWGGILASVVAGLALGPFMPLDVSAGQMQQTVNWLIRLAFFIAAGSVAGALLSLVRQQQARLQWFSLHNPATGLPNTEALIKDLSEIIADRRVNNRHTLILIQINNYEEILNALGARVGVDILKGVALRLLQMKPRVVQVYDLQGDKVAVLLADAEGGVEAFVRDVYRFPNRPLLVNDIPIYADLSLGGVSLSYGLRSAEELIQRANIARHQAFQRGSFYMPYAYTGDEVRKRNLELLARLPQAIEGSELFLEYQPKVDLCLGRTVGVEALVRWRHPQWGRIPPGDFIPLVERSALIHPLTQWVLQEALAYTAAMRAAGHTFAIAINLSPRNLGNEELLGQVRNLLHHYELPADCLELEITETAMLESSSKVIAGLSSLRAEGVRISIDDFGTGYTSLSQLADLPVDCLKIDQVFVRRLSEDSRLQNIVHTVIDLAKRLNLSTVAEGIEDRETAHLLAQMGCNIGQGFLFCRPVPAAALKQWLTTKP